MSGPSLFRMVFVTFPSSEVAREVSKAAVTEKLVACANIVPGLTSIYHWEGKVQTDEEVLVIYKTKVEAVNNLTQFIKSKHPYQVPEVLSIQIEEGNNEYLKWIDDSLQ